MPEFRHERHKPASQLLRPREMVIACAPMKSNINVAHIARTASCCGLTKIIVCGNANIDPKIARDGAEEIEIESRRTLLPVLKDLREQGYQLVGLEQATNSESLYSFTFQRKTALILGNERTGMTDEELALMDRVVEIPVYGLPHSYNVHTSAAMALYEYCRQFPQG